MNQPATSPVILLAYANDKDDYLPNLKLERTRLYKALQPILARDAIHVEQEWETSIDGLFEKLALFSSRIAIIHYAGHADGTSLQFETASGAETAHAAGLAQRFAQLPALQLVFLNGCATHGQVAALLDAGVKAVIATSVRINDAMATDFAAQFYTALADETGKATIETAFATARAFIATRDPSRRVELQRGAFNAARASSQDASLIWGLYARDDAATALAWRLPSAAPLDLKHLQERILRGDIDAADPELAMVFEIWKLKLSAAGVTAIPAAVVENFTATVTGLATAPQRALREVAISAVSGDVGGAYDQLIALAEANLVLADYCRTVGGPAKRIAWDETADALARFREAGALAAPSSITRAIAAYSRAAQLDPRDFVTSIELARLHDLRGALSDSQRFATTAQDNARNDRQRSIADNELGDRARASGDLAEARRRYVASFEIRERLIAVDPDNVLVQHDLLVSHERLGNLAALGGDLAEARRHFTAGLEIAVRQAAVSLGNAAADPDNSQWQRDLAAMHAKLGDLAAAGRDFTEARRCFTASLEIRRGLAAADPDNALSQCDLSDSYINFGDLATANRDFEEALRHFTAGLEIRECLAAADPDNTQWQSNLADSYLKLGDLAIASGDLEEAQRRFTADLEIRARLAAVDLQNSQWQRDLSISHENLGKLASANGNIAEARRRLTASLELRTRLAATDPHNSQWLRELSISHDKLGALAAKTGETLTAIGHYVDCHSIACRLTARWPDNLRYQSDLATIRQCLTELGADPDTL